MDFLHIEDRAITKSLIWVYMVNTELNFCRYLASKTSVDDRALNTHVWASLVQHLPKHPRILEIGAGIGTMLERFVARDAFSRAHYTAIDKEPSNIAQAKQRLKDCPSSIELQLQAIDVLDFIAQHQGTHWDVIVAHAFFLTSSVVRFCSNLSTFTDPMVPPVKMTVCTSQPF